MNKDETAVVGYRIPTMPCFSRWLDAVNIPLSNLHVSRKDRRKVQFFYWASKVGFSPAATWLNILVFIFLDPPGWKTMWRLKVEPLGGWPTKWGSSYSRSPIMTAATFLITLVFSLTLLPLLLILHQSLACCLYIWACLRIDLFIQCVWIQLWVFLPEISINVRSQNYAHERSALQTHFHIWSSLVGGFGCLCRSCLCASSLPNLALAHIKTEQLFQNQAVSEAHDPSCVQRDPGNQNWPWPPEPDSGRPISRIGSIGRNRRAGIASSTGRGKSRWGSQDSHRAWKGP